MIKNKEKYILISLGALHLILCTLLTILLLKPTIPLAYNFNEEIVRVGSKWVMLLTGIIPCFFVVASLFAKNRPALFWCKFLFAISLFETMIWFIYYGASTQLYVGAVSEISFAIAFFFPASFAVMAYGLKLKNPEYKSKTGINFKCVETTEFIWIQSHFFARYIFFFAGFLLFLISLVFAFFHMSYILLPIFVVAITVCYIITWNYATSMTKKYNEMKTRKENLDKRKTEKSEKTTEEPKEKPAKKQFKNPVIQTHRNPKKKESSK